MKFTRACLACTFILAARMALGSPVGTGIITGRVVDAAGQPVAAASVSLRKVPQNTFDLSSNTQMKLIRKAGDVDFGTVVTSATDGSFVANGLPNGAYDLCVQPPAGLLNTCTWTGGTTVVVPDASAGTRIVVARASTIRVRVDGLRLPAVSAASATILNPTIKIGVFDSRSWYHRADVESSDDAGITYSLDVLPGAKYRLNVSSLSVHILGPGSLEVDSRKTETPMSVQSPGAGMVANVELQAVP